MRIFRVLLRFCLALLVFALPGCHHGNEPVRETRFMMGTLVEFVVVDENRDRAQQAIRAAAARMQELSDALTIHGAADNTVKRLNRAPVGKAVRLSRDAATVLQAALSVERASGHAFHVGLGALNLLWGFSDDPPPNAPPDPARIRELVPPAECFRETPDGWIRLDARCQADFGGIAKGYIIDEGIRTLKDHGIRHAMINAGGDMRLLGDAGGRPWRIGIRDPRAEGRVLGVLALSADRSVVTSGDYERYFVWRGRRYHHILDPATGWPAGRARSATVVARDAMLADAWCTALFVMGPQGLARLPRGMPALVVDADGRLHANPEMEALLERGTNENTSR